MLRRHLKRIYYSTAYAALGRSRTQRLGKQNEAAILNLHRVSGVKSDYWPPLAPEVFEDLLQFLTSRFHLCDIRELATATSDKPIAALSFDDGYYDFVEYALPLLDGYGVPANMNIVPQCAITGKPIWNVRLYDYLHTASLDEINAMQIPGFAERLSTDDPNAKVRFGVAVSSYLKNRPRVERQEILKSIESTIDLAGADQTRMMTTEEIKQISDRVSIGAHSFSHESMAFEDDEFFEDDFRRCKSYFETELGTPLSIYAFPNGSYRPEQIDFLHRNGVEHVLLVDEKFADVKSRVLTRLTIYGDTGPEVRMKSLGF